MTDQLWVDKYRPRKLDDFLYNRHCVRTFKKLAQTSTDIPHLIIEGVSGVGKKSMAMAFIRECLDQYGLKGQEVYKTQNMEIDLKYPNKKISLNIQKSLFHYNLNPSDYGIYDRHIVQDFLKSQFMYKQLTGFPYKTVIIRNAENLSFDAQQSLRRTLETCIKNCRFIFIVNTDRQGNLIMALNSRCIRIRLSTPFYDEAVKVIHPILENENLSNIIDDRLIKSLYRKCGENMTKILNFLQLLSSIYSSRELKQMRTISMPDLCPVTKCCNDIVTQMYESQNLLIIAKIRIQLYTLLTHGINSEDIIKRIFEIVIRNIPGSEIEVINLTDQIESKLGKSSRDFYHLECYIVKLLVLIKSHQKQKSITKNQKPTKKINKVNKIDNNKINKTDKNNKTNNDKINKTNKNNNKINKIDSINKINKIDNNDKIDNNSDEPTVKKKTSENSLLYKAKTTSEIIEESIKSNRKKIKYNASKIQLKKRKQSV